MEFAHSCNYQTNNMAQTKAEQQLVMGIKEDPQPVRVQSLCVECGKNGQTILLLTKIPFFKQMLIGSFSCQDCGNRNNEVQFVGELPSKGISIRFKVTQPADLNRQIIKSEHASIKFQELQLELPSTKRAQITTVQGLLLKVSSDLQGGQDQRKIADYDTYLKIQSLINKIKDFAAGKFLPFYVSLLDPSGNSNIKNPFTPKLDERLFVTNFTRTKEQLIQMGYSDENAKQEQHASTVESHMKKIDFNEPVTENDFMNHEPSMFEISCHACDMPGLMKLCQTNIPHFRDLIIMSFSCDYCGAHSTDTKTSGAVTDKCTNITLNVKEAADLKRQIYKSESCCVKIPDIELELDYGTLGGAYTTVEGLLEKIKCHMEDLNPYTDSDDDFASKIRAIIKKLEDMMAGRVKFTLILEDPLSNSFLQNRFHPEEDQNVVTITRERTEDEKDYLGINQMSV